MKLKQLAALAAMGLVGVFPHIDEERLKRLADYKPRRKNENNAAARRLRQRAKRETKI